MTKEQTILITPQGYLALETELNDLKLNKRPEVIAALQEARSLGDLSENAEYDAARNEQAQVEARIKELEFKLEHCQVMDGNSKDTVSVGSSVVLNYIDDDEEEEYSIVGSMEADPFANKISNESPIGKAILGHKAGETVNVVTPNGSYDVKIVKIDVDEFESIAKSHGVMSIPTLEVYRDGKLIKKEVGYRDYDTIASWFIK